jgi:hypothetical protein
MPGSNEVVISGENTVCGWRLPSDRLGRGMERGMGRFSMGETAFDN